MNAQTPTDMAPEGLDAEAAPMNGLGPDLTGASPVMAQFFEA